MLLRYGLEVRDKLFKILFVDMTIFVSKGSWYIASC